MKRFEAIIIAVNRWALILLLAAMAIIVFANVCLRYFTNNSIIWSDEVARYLMIWMAFLGAGLAFRHGGLVAIDNVQFALSQRNGRIMRGIVAAIMFAFFCGMIWVGITYVQRTMFQMTPATRVPFAYVYSAIPIGFGLLILHFLFVVKQFVLGGMGSLQEEEDAPPPVTG
ncbi:TRAP transporter small permease [Limoniibacter endophyticus]|uniref:TRAP transporter small permease protein n=1 Tax=Limoniibacter endophyticus TaxID=1565040 RepID=A0A8J3DMJ2_9HYPH|nr:TRAP transporter small permease [Limoniibacter endophyticus]GHC67687.1 membrane protein [Limoniibacter endophyticus]